MATAPSPPRLAVIATHPIQYQAPWFRHLNLHLRAQVCVFYLDDFGVRPRLDHGFGQPVCWDVDLLSGYDHRFVPNQARDPGAHHFGGFHHSDLAAGLLDWNPDAILLHGYRYRTHLQLLTSPSLRHLPFLFRGDSHLLAEQAGPARLAVKRLFLNLLFRRFAAFLPVGHANTGYFLRHGVPIRKLFPTPYAIDESRFSPSPAIDLTAREWRCQLGIPEHHAVILFAGKFETKKRPDLLIRAFLSLDSPGTTLLLAGAGTLETDLRRLAGSHPRIRFAPFQNQSLMPRTYAAADLVVLPSQGPGETWGLAINEAFAMARPVIVSDHVGCHPDLVHSFSTGLVFAAGNASDLASALHTALRDPSRLRRWGAGGRELVLRSGYAQATAGLQRALDFVLPRKRSVRRLHFWVPELQGPGGIQSYSRLLTQAAVEIAPQARLRVLIKNGPPPTGATSSPRCRYYTAPAWPAYFRTARFTLLLVRHALLHRPDLIIVTHLHFAPVASRLHRLIGLRYWVVVHGLEWKNRKSPRLERALARAEKILPVSRHTAHALGSLNGAVRGRVALLPNAVDAAGYFPGVKPLYLLQKYRLTSRHQILLTVSRLDSRERYKGHDLVLCALPRLREKNPDIHYLIVGQGNDSPRLQAETGRLGLHHHVTFAGFVPESELRDHYNLCDLFVMPSRHEGFGIVYLEALACGKPVIAGNADGAAEPLLDGELGILVDPDDPSQLADAILKILAQPPPDSAHLRNRMLEHFGLDAFRRRLTRLLET